MEVRSGLPMAARHRARLASCPHVTAAASMGPHRMLEHLRRRWLNVLHLHSNGAAAEVMGKSGSRRGGLAPLLGDRWRKKPLSGVALLGGVEAGVVWRHGEFWGGGDGRCAEFWGGGDGARAELGVGRELRGVRSLLELIKFSGPK